MRNGCVFGGVSFPQIKGSPPACRRRTLGCKRVLDYEVRAAVFYGSLRERIGENGFHEHLWEACFVLTEISEHIRKLLYVRM